MEQALNCWEYKHCGREPGGMHSDELGICPAAKDRRLDRVHGGKNAGRACWVVAGTLARGNVEGTCAREYDNCAMCDFYKLVKAEEGRYFWPPKLLLKVLGDHTH